jgi:DNA-binding NtrC family response regulator
MKSVAQILIVDDEPNVRKVLGALLEQAGYATTRGESAEQALDLVRSQDPDLVLTDLRMPGMDGLELLRRLRRDFPEIPVVLLTAHGTVESAVEAMKRGAHDFLTKPFDKEKVLEVIAGALAHAERARREFQGPLVEGPRCGIVGRSLVMEEMFRLIEKVAPSPSTVLVTGETGPGKELVAESIHRLSPRRDGPLVRINCGALPENLVEAELFGYERGAFTGAERSKPGRFELADGGTLFLDEIGELPIAAQVKLLRVLQDGNVDRIGGTGPHHVDVRLVAATNTDLASAATGGRFREDLLYRLRVVEVRVPPLRERAQDIPLLVDFFLGKHAHRLGGPLPGILPEAVADLAGRPWPGNVRELENAVERALLLGEGPVLTPFDFGVDAGRGASSSDRRESSRPESGLKGLSRTAAAEVERRHIRAALEATGGNVTRSAERLGLSRRGLQIKMKALGLRPDTLQE